MLLIGCSGCSWGFIIIFIGSRCSCSSASTAFDWALLCFSFSGSKASLGIGNFEVSFNNLLFILGAGGVIIGVLGKVVSFG